MAIGLGSFTPSKLYLGVTEVSKAYLGASVAYEVGGGAWTPAELGASLALWLDADDASTITLNGSTVSQWSDKSSNAIPFSQPTASSQPSYGASGLAKNTLNFDGVDDVLDGDDVLDSVWTGAAWQIFLVAKNNAADTSNGAILAKVSNSPLNLRQFASYLRVNRSQLITLYTPDTANYTVVNGSTVIADSQWVFSSQAYTDTGTGSSNTTERVEIVVDGAEQTEVVNASSGSLETIKDTESHLSIGGIIADGTQSSGFLNGSVGEIIVTSTITSLADRQRIEGYLAWKWGLEANLPADHPYKSTPPISSSYDPDAQAYFDRVEGPTGDGQALETAIKDAINAFVIGCKADGIWTAIKSSAILAGARTLNGALQPLVGTAPTNFNFVAGDYDRKTGLKGDGSTKYLNSNRDNRADPQNNNHNSVYYTEQGNIGSGLICAGSTTAAQNIYDGGTNFFIRNRSSAAATTPYLSAGFGFIGHRRINSANFDLYADGTLTNQSLASLTPVDANVVLFQRDGTAFSTYRLSFYSIGESLDLALLDARVSTLMTDLGAAIP